MTPSSAPARTIPTVTADAAARFAECTAIEDGPVSLTYAELADEARRFAAALVAGGIQPGDRVAIWAPNSVRWVVAVLGLWKAGAVLVPINTRFKGGEAVDLLIRSRARVLVTVTDFLGTDFLAMLTETGVDLPDLQLSVVADGPVSQGARIVGGVRRAGNRRHPTRGGSTECRAQPR